MRKTLLTLALLCVNPLAHATLIQGGALYEDGSTFDFVWDDAREGANGRPYTLITFTHDTFSFSKTCCGFLRLIESTTDEGDLFGDSIEDTWSFSGIDLTQDDYFFFPTYFYHAGGNHDGWHSGNDLYRVNAVHSYVHTLVPEPSSLSLLLLGAIGLLLHRKKQKGY